VFFGLAIAFKLQAVFFLPVLLIVLVVNRQRLLSLLAVPATFAMMLLPAALAGRDLTSLLMVYPNQISTGGTGVGGAGFGAGSGGGPGRAQDGAAVSTAGGGQPGAGFARSAATGDSLTQNAPTVFQWIGSAASVWRNLGLAAAAVIAAGVAAVVLLRRRRLNGPEIVVMATTVVLAVPFVLPEMHERYFYLADVLTIVTAFYVRRYWPVAMVVSACSLLSYAPFLWQRTFVALPLVAFAEFLAVIATVLVFGNVVGPGGAGSWLRRPVPRAGLGAPVSR
jgi:Gpi18-like mannosyltransferase